MKPAILLFLILLLTATASARTKNPSSDTVAFVNVNVIPMDKERVLRRQSVIVRNGVIVEIGDARRIKIPASAQRIDGAGKFLIPGLTDTHLSGCSCTATRCISKW